MEEVPEGWVTTDDATDISGYGRARLFQLRMIGKISTWKIGRTVLYNRLQMEELRRERERKEKGNDQE